MWKFLILALALVCPAWHATAGDREQFVGMWTETHPKDHLLHIADDGSWKLYLRKKELADVHALSGTWVLAPDGTVKMTVHLNGNTQTFTSKVKFDGDQMFLTDKDGTETRHRRHQGAIPERFQW